MQIAFIEGNVGNAPFALHVVETAIGSGNVVHHFLQNDALAIEAIAPSQCLVGVVPVDTENDFVCASANPIKDFRRLNLGFIGQRIHGCNFLFPDVNVVFRVNQSATIGIAPFHIVAIGQRLDIKGVP